MRKIWLILFLLEAFVAQAQESLAFTRITTDDNMGLTANVIYSLHQDERGFIWVGTANGLQRFDGGKFIQFGPGKAGGDPIPYTGLNQIIPVDSGRMIFAFNGLRELGIFNPSDFSYNKIAVKPNKVLPPKANFFLWKDYKGEVFLNIRLYGILHYKKAQNAFVDDNFFRIPADYSPTLNAYYDDPVKQQVWFGSAKGICVYDRSTGQVWDRSNNPQNLPVLNAPELQENPTKIYIDKKRRFWIFCWPKNGLAGNPKYCVDSNARHLKKDTVGMLEGINGYSEYNHFFEPGKGGMWTYGVGVLFNWNESKQRFVYHKSITGSNNNSIEYSSIHQMMEDRDGNIWLATDRGLYFTSDEGGRSVINFLLDERGGEPNILDILEMPGGDLWLASWGYGLIVLDSSLNWKKTAIYKTPPPADWPEPYRKAITLGWTLYRQPATGDVWLGCNGGVIVIYNPEKGTTKYLWPPEANKSTIRFITQDHQGKIWMGTQGGRLLVEDGKAFKIVLDIGNIIYKIFVDREGLLWLATQDKGLYCVDPVTHKVLKHYTADGSANSLYSNSGKDIEQLFDGTIVYGAIALNFINKKDGSVKQLRYEDGLPSNSVDRLRLDGDGYLWMITADGLARYNPYKKRITRYGRKDGIILSALVNYTDYFSSKKYIMFGGLNALLMFKTELFANTKAPPDPVITDFKIFNQFMPVDSLLQLPQIKLPSHQNSINIYFSSLSYQQQDRLTYYFKLEGVDKDWQAADGVYSQSYSLLPAGEYTFKVYAENVEGIRSAHTTEIRISIKPPFYRTKWFIATIVFLILLVIYFLHRERLHRLLAVEKLRNRVARDLHDDMGSTLSTINILSAMAKSKMTTDPVKTATYIGKISDNSQRMMEAMDDIVWSIKPSNDSMQRVTARMREFATNVLEAKDMLLHFTVAEEVMDVKLDMEARRDFFLIFKEALNNAAKYSKATQVWVDTFVQNKQLSFSIKDNGVGFDVAKADNGNGLGNMQKRADGMNGKLRIKSTEGEGTEVKLTIPVM